MAAHKEWKELNIHRPRIEYTEKLLRYISGLCAAICVRY